MWRLSVPGSPWSITFSNWIQAVVWNKYELRIARKEIVWDEGNMRWETGANAAFECLVQPIQ